MSELRPDLERLLARATFTLVSALEKVDAASPTWEELPTLLTEDELRVFLAFVGRVDWERPDGLPTVYP